MKYKKSIIDILRDVVNGMTFQVFILDYTNNGDGTHTLVVDDMYFAQVGFQVTIGGKKYTIEGIEHGEIEQCESSSRDTILIKGASGNIAATNFNLYLPFFFHGTPLAQGVELGQITQAKNKTPMIWFYEQFTERFYENEMDTRDRTASVRIFFLTQADHDKWITDDAYHYAIEPMRRLAIVFIEELKKYPYLFDIDELEYDLLNYAKFGVFISERGMDKKLWHDNLAGCELSGSITVYKQNGCEKYAE